MSAPKVKHVAPYPIAIRIMKAEGQPPLLGNIVKITEFGFLMKVDGSQLYKVGDECKVSFELPAIHQVITTDTKVMKTYDGYEISGTKSKVKINTIEMHFKTLSGEHRKHLENYLVQSGQKKR
jgi:hypothetical protein